MIYKKTSCRTQLLFKECSPQKFACKRNPQYICFLASLLTIYRKWRYQAI